ncbi:MAG TPA: dipeptidase [Chloroflexi bacterium]|nr:dipeptidase [Chloroflexota bacterium]
MHPLEYAQDHRSQFLTELQELLRIPSISTQPSYRPDIERAAQWLRAALERAGFPRVEVFPTPRHPVVYAEWPASDSEAPTLLVYGHYDVQPPDPLDLWTSPPFEPTIVGDDIFARGAADDKGQLYIHVKAAEAFHQTVGAPPVTLKCIFEGEEEIGSPSLEPFLQSHANMLAADVAVISDTHILGPETPSIVYALRGMSYVEVEVTGPDHDLHSGIYGGAVHNPIHALCAMIAQLHDANGHITIPGFYDRVRPLSAEERAEMSNIPFDRDAWLQEAGVPTDWGEPEYTIVERTSARPTLDVNGIWGGYIQPGAKTVLPSKAYAKISMRLVPDQEPAEIARLIEEHLRRIAPPTVSLQVSRLHGGQPAIVRRDTPAMQAAVQAYAETFGRKPIFVREGGSIPVVTTFQRTLGLETVLMGFGLPDDRLHSPNEKFHIPNFYRGIETVIRFWELLAS